MTGSVVPARFLHAWAFICRTAESSTNIYGVEGLAASNKIALQQISVGLKGLPQTFYVPTEAEDTGADPAPRAGGRPKSPKSPSPERPTAPTLSQLLAKHAVVDGPQSIHITSGILECLARTIESEMLKRVTMCAPSRIKGDVMPDVGLAKIYKSIGGKLFVDDPTANITLNYVGRVGMTPLVNSLPVAEFHGVTFYVDAGALGNINKELVVDSLFC